MKFSIEGENLKKAVADVKSGLGDNKSLAIFQSILIKADENIMFQTQDSLVKLTTTTIGDIDEVGEFRCDGNSFIATVSQLTSNDVVDVYVKNDILHINQGGAKIKFKKVEGIVEEKESDSEPIVFEAVANEFAKGLSNAVICVSKENSRPALRGVNLSSKGGKIRISSLDGFRASRSYCGYSNDNVLVPAFSVILPTKGIGSIVALCNSCEKIKVSVYKNKVICEGNAGIVETGLIDGDFYDVDKQFSSPCNFEIKANKEEIKKAVALSSITTNNTYNGIVLNFDTDSKKLCIESQKDSAESSIEINIETEQSGSTFTLVLNSVFLMDIVKNTSGDNVIFNIVSESRPIIFTEEDSENAFLVLPIRRM